MALAQGRSVRLWSAPSVHWPGAALVAVALLAGCHVEGRSRRAERLLAEVAPTLHFGQSLADARRAIPTLGVRHPGDPTNLYLADDSGVPRVVAVIVQPEPAAGEHASSGALVEGVELVTTPEIAAKLRQHITKQFGKASESTCAGQSLEQIDLVMLWDTGGRGGILLTVPERRPDGIVPTSRLFIYTSGWAPDRSLSGFGRPDCTAAS